jgi:hyperosmotically inducible protein
MKVVYVFLAFALAFSLLAGCQHFTGKTAGQTIDDAAITADIKGKILKTPGLKTMAIDVDTFQGNVTLSGAVAGKEAEQEAIRLARTTNGVKSVKNNLHVQPQMTRPIIDK